MKLPTEKTKPIVTLSTKKILLYGPPKIGKSTFFSRADDVLFLATEPGLSSLECYQMPIRSWADIKDVFVELKGNAHPFKSVCIDTVDQAYNLCEMQIKEQYKVEHIGDDALAYGKGYALAQSMFSNMIKAFCELPLGLFLTSHARIQEMDVPGGLAKITKMVPTLPEKMRVTCLALMDMILAADYVTVQDDKGAATTRRVIRTKGNQFVEAGDRTGRLPETLDLAWRPFCAAYEQNGTGPKTQDQKGK